MLRFLVILSLTTLSACHTQAPRVRCDAKLQPINAPAPIAKGGAATSTSP
jgi:hypothetical protein